MEEGKWTRWGVERHCGGEEINIKGMRKNKGMMREETGEVR